MPVVDVAVNSIYVGEKAPASLLIIALTDGTTEYTVTSPPSAAKLPIIHGSVMSGCPVE